MHDLVSDENERTALLQGSLREGQDRSAVRRMIARRRGQVWRTPRRCTIAETTEINLSLLNRSLREGQSNPAGKDPIIYVGTVSALDVDGDEDALAEEKDELAELLRSFRTPDGSVWEFAAEGIVERYEVLDTDTGKLMVMWRVPFRKAAE